MNKNFIRFMIALWSGVAIFLGFVLVLVIARGDAQSQVFSFNGKWKQSKELEAETFVFEPTQIKNIELDLSSQDVKFIPHDKNEIKVVYYATKEARKEREVGIEQQGETLSIYKSYEKSVSDRIFQLFSIHITQQTVIEVYMPKGFGQNLDIQMSSGGLSLESQQLGDVKVKKSSGSTKISQLQATDLFMQSSSGSIRIEDTQAKNAELTASSGSVILDDVEVDQISVTASSGALRVEDLSAKEAIFKTNSGSKIIKGIDVETLEVSSSSGSLNLQGNIGELKVQSSSGSNKIILDKMPKKVSVEATSGSVRVIIPENKGFSFEYHKTSGRFSTDFSLQEEINTRDQIKGIYGDGSSKISVQTSSGSFSLKRE